MSAAIEEKTFNGRVGEGRGPPPPSSNRTCGFPASGLPGILGTEHAFRGTWLDTAARVLASRCPPKRTFLGVASMCHGTPLTRTAFRQGPFAPRALPRFPATTAPSDSHNGPATVIDSRRRLAWPGDEPCRRCGPLRFLDESFDVRRPQPPRRSRPLPLLVASRPVLASPSQEGWPSPFCVTRPNRVHLRCGWRLRLPRLRTAGFPTARSVSYMAHEHLPWSVPFNQQDSPGFA